jgi:hypothetical protein
LKRLLQLAALFQALLGAWLLIRVGEVSTVAAPTFPELVAQPAILEVSPPPPRVKILPSVLKAITGADLFDAERGDRPPPAVVAGDDITFEEPPLPPPTTITVSGILLLGAEPEAIMTDATQGTEPRRVRSGDMIGDYEIGEISATSVELLGSTPSEVFDIGLTIAAGTGATAAVATAKPAAAANAARIAAQRKAAEVRKAAVSRTNDKSNAAKTARERAQAAQKARAAGKGQGNAAQPDPKRDPVQLRLEALQRLREAATKR